MSELDKLERLKQSVLTEYPRLSRDDTFLFRCHPGVPCFNRCCGDVTIILTPYDVLRMKRRLGLSSEAFLEKHTFIPFTKEQKLPIPMLRMNDDEHKTCPFVGADGCGVYDDRPWACRMYPLGMATPKAPAPGQEEFFFLLQEKDCEGHQDEHEWTVRQWLEDQGIDEYNRMGALFQEIVHHDWLLEGNELEPAKMEMFYMACYDLDKFRRFVFESSFLEKFDVDAERLDRIRADDVELMTFAFLWLKFCLFGEKTMTVKDEVVQKMRPD